MKWTRVYDRRDAGGQGSGNYGHAGRPGEVGGSAPGFGSLPDVPILKGVDSKANADRMVAESPLTPEQRAASMEELASLPLVHGTSVEGALAAASEGLQSAKSLEAHLPEMMQEADALRASFTKKLGVSEDDDYLQEVAHMGHDEGVRAIEDQYGVDRDTAKEVYEEFMTAVGIDQAVSGHTFKADRELGLDQFVFMTHGALHQDYGPIGVVIDNRVLDNAFETREDIVKTNAKVTTAWGETPNMEKYSPTVVPAYQYQMTTNKEDYLRAASTQLTDVGQQNRSRDQLWEIKTPSVSKRDVIGFFTSDMDAGQRLAEHGKDVLWYDDTMRGASQFLHKQLQYRQKYGKWDQDLIDEHDGGAAIL